jgi:mono/diheme cytochrome c family protein
LQSNENQAIRRRQESQPCKNPFPPSSSERSTLEHDKHNRTLFQNRTLARQEDFMRSSILVAAMLILGGACGAQSKPTPGQDQIPTNFVPSGKAMFKQYCAACHGLDAKGHGPARAALKVPAADLTTLARRHGGEFPTELVTNILRFGPGVAAHGSSDMPTWGGIFQYMDNYNQAVVQKRIKNLIDYLMTLQEK